ncbi:MAG: TonB-dependent receptor [Edaphobacter sp.]
MRRIAALLFVYLFAHSMFAQSTNASVTGFIQDSSKAFIPGVTVVAINTGTDAQFVTKTDKSGSYELPSLPAGPYRMQIEKPGFKTILKENLDLHVQAALEVNFQMAVGSSSESVTITGTTADVQMNGTVSTVIDRQMIENMPLNGKDLQTLFELSPGTILNAGGTAANGGGFSVDGQRPTANYLTIDGASGNAFVSISSAAGNVTGATIATSASGGTNGILPVDAIEEYRMDTSTYTAENGRTPGGQIQVRTRSGTNEFHGTLFENFRNQVLDAKDWFVKYNNIPQSQLRMNDFGGTLGGPLLRSKLFFFVAHDTLDLNQPVTATDIDVPSQATRQSAAAVFQPLLKVFPAGNIVSSSSCAASDPYCDPSLQGFDFYSASYPFVIRNHTTSVRIDSQLPHSSHAFFRANLAPSSSSTFAVNGTQAQVDIYTYTGGITSPLRVNLVNDITINRTTARGSVGYLTGSTGGNEPDALKNNLPSGINPAVSGFALYVNPKASSLAQIGPSLYNGLSQWNETDKLSWQHGKHTVTTGVDFLNKTTTINGGSPGYGIYLAYTDPYPYLNLQNGIADYYNYVTRTNEPVISIRNTSVFVNDTWKLFPSLTLSAGVRWEFNPAPSVGPLGVLAVAGNDVNPATITATVTNRPLYKTTYDNFAPRFGFAWTLPGHTRNQLVIRGGAGTYFDTGQASVGAGAATQSYPYGGSSPLYTNIQYQSIDWSNTTAATSSTFPLSSANLVDPSLIVPRTYEWSLTLEQSFGGAAKLSTSYVGNDGEQLIAETSYYNKKTSTGQYPVNPLLLSSNSYLYLTANRAHSNYQALQTQFTGRMSSRLNALLSYTWEHAEDNGATEFTAVGGSVAYPIANSAFDIRHQFAGAIHYEPHGWNSNKVGHALTDGWAFDTISRLQTSPPFSVISTNSNPNGFLSNVDIVPGQPVVLHESHNSLGRAVPGGKLLNYSAFVAPPTDSSGNPIRQGNSSTNGYRLFDLKQWDLSASHSWRLFERVALNFRVDAFNVLNLANFANPNGSWTKTNASTFGMSSATYAGQYGSLPSTHGTTGTQLSVFQNGGNRSLQLSLKLKF